MSGTICGPDGKPEAGPSDNLEATQAPPLEPQVPDAAVKRPHLGKRLQSVGRARPKSGSPAC
jgi:hypothetical protein